MASLVQRQAGQTIALSGKVPVRVFLLDNSFKTILADVNTTAEVRALPLLALLRAPVPW